MSTSYLESLENEVNKLGRSYSRKQFFHCSKMVYLRRKKSKNTKKYLITQFQEF
jgi:hypothetical protein